MRILELLLPKGTSDRSLSPQVARKIDALQQRMDGYVDKIMDPKTSLQGKEFLKSRLRDDYYELKNVMPRVHHVAENDIPTQYEVYDTKTGKTVPKRGPYNDRSRARRAVDQLDNAYGAYRYGYRPIGQKLVTEAVRRLPLSDDDFKFVKELMLKPIPAVIAPIYILEIIDDDELNDTLTELENSNPGMDVRPIVVEWINRVMPDQMYRFTGDVGDHDQKEGRYSVVHGYDPKMYKGTNDPITGNAYGSR